MKRIIFICILAMSCITLAIGCDEQGKPPEKEKPVKKDKPATIGVYYFDGWSGKNSHADSQNQPWAKNAPTHLTRRFVEEFPEREPVWGWRNDSPEIMKQQIDLAADNGVDFFLFCWYWRDDKGSINPEVIKKDHHHTSMELYLKAPNKKKLKYSLLVANHSGAEIIGKQNWIDAVKFWAEEYFRDPQYITVDGKPLVVLFETGITVTEEDLAAMQQTAKEAGFKDGIAIAGCGAPARQKSGFTHTTHYNIIPGYAAGSEEHKYQELVDATEAQWIGREDQPYIPLLTAGWDKRPWEDPDRKSQEGWYYPDSSPEQFKKFLKDAITWMDTNPTKTTKERLVLIYAWNELGEGGYLVPTKGDPEAAKLKKIKEVADGK